MRANNDTRLSGPIAEELTPLEISQGILEGEENPSALRAVTPLERAASGEGNGGEPPRSRIGRFLLNPLVLGGAAATGVGLILALAYAKKTPRSELRAHLRTLGSFRF
ncbi:hypothetical protein NU688_08420 [Variovorax sp. ZS18.2.2]|uniref:hypothetical protein n=1 Tax=Variovorax sp. ZS18.2.2 TaxID=2971255 RepID=UPI002150AB2F|nr:hypothetical protein [Variovorax sp. ZS18.2.2]MCR6476177.1 hypothetical protein [Variovorax sp. ZS18.2.2]